MIKGHQNTYIGGMDKDTSKAKYTNSKYANALNLRPVTDKGFSTGAMENIKGNEILVRFPQIGPSLVLEANVNNVLDQTQVYTHHFIINLTATTTLVNTVISFSTYDELFSKMMLALANKPSSYVRTKLENDNRIVIYFPSTLIGYHNNQPSGYVDWEIRQTFDNFVIHGHRALRDKIVVSTFAQVGASGFGQVWLLSYDIKDPLNTGEVELVYNDRLNFSKDHPVEIETRYESINTQRAYLTDNFNKMKAINVAQEDVLAVRVSDLLLSPEVRLYPAHVNTEDSLTGNCPAGLYYVTYKLQKENGNITPIAPFLNPTPVFIDTISTSGGDGNYEDVNYTNGLLLTTKALNYKIPELPVGFDKIIIYAIIEDLPGNYNAYQIKTEFLDNKLSYEFQINTIDTAIQTTVADILLYDIDFETVKTITSKDNTLLFGNVTVKNFKVDFDARAYRFNKNTTTTYTTIDITKDNWDVPLTADVINPMNRDSTIGTNDYRFQYGTNVLGGSGPNVSYEFTFEKIILDDSAGAAPSNTSANMGTYGSALMPMYTPFVNQAAKDSIPLTLNNGQIVEAGPGFLNFKNNRYETYLKGYMRDEVYRFGIVFISNSGKISAVNWIGDIRMPSAGDYSTQYGTVICEHYDDVNPNGAIQNPADGYCLGIKFSVDVTSLVGDVKGAMIVRCSRKPEDKTIIAEGALNKIREGTITAGNTLYNYTDVIDANNGNTGTPRWEYFTFDSPDLKFNTGLLKAFKSVESAVSQNNFFSHINAIKISPPKHLTSVITVEDLSIGI